MKYRILNFIFQLTLAISSIQYITLGFSNALPLTTTCNELLVSNISAIELDESPFDELKSERRKEYAKNYIFANMQFPQFSSGIVSALVTYYFTHEISFQEMMDTFNKDYEYELMVKAMNAAHSAHGVKKIDLAKLDEVIDIFKTRLKYSLRNTFLHFVTNNKKFASYYINQLEANYASDPDLKRSVDLIRLYSSTVQKALKSESAKEMSNRYKLDLKLAIEESDNEKKNRVIYKYSQELTIIVVSYLENHHPELREMVAPKTNPNGQKRTRAYLFWIAISRTGMEFMGI